MILAGLVRDRQSSKKNRCPTPKEAPHVHPRQACLSTPALPARPVLDDAAMAAAATAYDAAMATRHTVRDFTDRPVPRAIVETCIRTAALAPSGANHQPWHFSLIGDSAMKAEIRAAAEAEVVNFTTTPSMTSG